MRCSVVRIITASHATPNAVMRPRTVDVGDVQLLHVLLLLLCEPARRLAVECQPAQDLSARARGGSSFPGPGPATGRRCGRFGIRAALQHPRTSRMAATQQQGLRRGRSGTAAAAALIAAVLLCAAPCPA
jgi:hypothetical protein